MYNSDEDKQKLQLAQLTILQGIITRMSNYVLAIQTGAVTALIGLLVYSKTPNSHMGWYIIVVPWFLFIMYHFYFLKLEHKFRYLYNEVVQMNMDQITVDILRIDRQRMENAEKQVKKAWADMFICRPFSSPFSRPLFGFYLPLIILILVNH